MIMKEMSGHLSVEDSEQSRDLHIYIYIDNTTMAVASSSVCKSTEKVKPQYTAYINIAAPVCT